MTNSLLQAISEIALPANARLAMGRERRRGAMAGAALMPTRIR
jgi:hypothetical protein